MRPFWANYLTNFYFFSCTKEIDEVDENMILLINWLGLDAESVRVVWTQWAYVVDGKNSKRFMAKAIFGCFDHNEYSYSKTVYISSFYLHAKRRGTGLNFKIIMP